MSRFMLAYIDRPSPVHAVSGAVKLVVFILWSVLAMAGYDTRVMAVLVVMGLSLFAVSGTKLREVSFIFKMLVVFMALNLIAIYIFAPEQGVEIYGTKHLILKGIGRYSLTWEQLFYEFNIFLKYCTIVPIAILLIVTTHPSEFASSLNRIGVNYSIAYAVSLALRYIPDVQRDYQNISQAQQARGIELSRKVSWVKRLRGSARILLPLVLSSLERIDAVSHAMELRSFGKYKKRTWYSSRPFSRMDAAVLAVSLVLFGFGMWFTFRDGSRFFNPFI
ncbi:energy-coupling factor transporter transmembrane component T family protein [Breznakiella homolactica]|uniref:Energy-coupling factor transporter transmembrane protein EcfT n=1 Tax=Breznakiella homolactica TaxID=2798577 RepID=A0A7T7XMX0_9SPIR|nr:energy-coupling factor transporter transmembrane component T [Breznakiella homolactica]QQO09280.1 energy-coupling factor transporter transmembrane protein EcfT [Breznakiella homolactica]